MKKITGIVLALILLCISCCAMAGGSTAVDWDNPYTTITSQSAPDWDGTVIPKSYFGKVLRVHDVVGGCFKFTVPATGKIKFTVLAKQLPYETFSMRFYRKNNSTGSWEQIERLYFSASDKLQTGELTDIKKGETIAFWNDDGSGRAWTLRQDYLLKMDSVTSVKKPKIATDLVNEITTSSAQVHFTVTDYGGAKITDAGIQYGYKKKAENTVPFGEVGKKTGTFALKLTGLKDNKTVYYRAYATNKKGTSYGSWEHFKTKKIKAPTVVTLKEKNKGSVSVKLGLKITSDGGAAIKESGILWGYSEDKIETKIKFSKKKADGKSVYKLVKGLELGSTIYYMAYARNAVDTGYGAVQSLTLGKGSTITASFTHKEKTIALGEKWKIEASVSVENGKLGKVTINSPDVKGSMTYDYSGEKVTEADLKNQPNFTIDTTKEPWNKEGTYTLRLYAKDTEGLGGKKLAVMTVKIVPGWVYPASVGTYRQWNKKRNDNDRPYHVGLDLGTGDTEGEEVVATSAGIVTFVKNDDENYEDNPSTGNGNQVVIKHTMSDGSICYSFYAHLKKGSVCVKKGQEVKTGQKIAEVGHTGSGSNGINHCHFSILYHDGDESRAGFLGYVPNSAKNHKNTYQGVTFYDPVYVIEHGELP